MDRKSTLPILIASGAWLICFLLSFFLWWLTAPTGDSFARGMNRLMILLGWQAVGFLFAIASGIMAFSMSQRISSRLKWLGYTPLLVSGLCVLGVVLLVLYVQFRPG